MQKAKVCYSQPGKTLPLRLAWWGHSEIKARQKMHSARIKLIPRIFHSNWQNRPGGILARHEALAKHHQKLYLRRSASRKHV